MSTAIDIMSTVVLTIAFLAAVAMMLGKWLKDHAG